MFMGLMKRLYGRRFPQQKDEVYWESYRGRWYVPRPAWQRRAWSWVRPRCSSAHTVLGSPKGDRKPPRSRSR